MDQPIRVLLVEDHELARRGAGALLADNGMVVAAGASTVSGALHVLERIEPDVALVDLHLPDGSGLDVCDEIVAHHPGVGCVVLTASDDPHDIEAAARAGAAGYVVKSAIGGALVACVLAVAQGRFPIRSQLTARSPRRAAGDRSDPRLDSLSIRETEVLSLIALGLTNREISARTHLAEKTVKNYVSALLAKLDLSRRTQAAVLYLAAQAATSRAG